MEQLRTVHEPKPRMIDPVYIADALEVSKKSRKEILTDSRINIDAFSDAIRKKANESILKKIKELYNSDASACAASFVEEKGDFYGRLLLYARINKLSNDRDSLSFLAVDIIRKTQKLPPISRQAYIELYQASKIKYESDLPLLDGPEGNRPKFTDIYTHLFCFCVKDIPTKNISSIDALFGYRLSVTDVSDIWNHLGKDHIRILQFKNFLEQLQGVQFTDPEFRDKSGIYNSDEGILRIEPALFCFEKGITVETIIQIFHKIPKNKSLPHISYGEIVDLFSGGYTAEEIIELGVTLHKIRENYEISLEQLLLLKKEKIPLNILDKVKSSGLHLEAIIELQKHQLLDYALLIDKQMPIADYSFCYQNEIPAELINKINTLLKDAVCEIGPLYEELPKVIIFKKIWENYQNDFESFEKNYRELRSHFPETTNLITLISSEHRVDKPYKHHHGLALIAELTADFPNTSSVLNILAKSPQSLKLGAKTIPLSLHGKISEESLQFIRGFLVFTHSKNISVHEETITEALKQYSQSLNEFLEQPEPEIMLVVSASSITGDDDAKAFKTNTDELIAEYHSRTDKNLVFDCSDSLPDHRKTTPELFIEFAKKIAQKYPKKPILINMLLHGGANGVAKFHHGDFTPRHFEALANIGPNIILDLYSCYSGYKLEESKTYKAQDILAISSYQMGNTSYDQYFLEVLQKNLPEADLNGDGKVGYYEARLYAMMHYRYSFTPTSFRNNQGKVIKIAKHQENNLEMG